MNKSVKAKLKKRLGLPPARNIGSKETKAAMKRLDRRMPLGEFLLEVWAIGLVEFGDVCCFLNKNNFKLLLMEEIRRSPVEVGTLSHYLQGFIYISQVVQEFFHQQSWGFFTRRSSGPISAEFLWSMLFFSPRWQQFGGGKYDWPKKEVGPCYTKL